MTYRAALNDIRFALNAIVGAGRLAETERYADATPELVDQIVEEAGRFTTEVLAPLNTVGDRQGSHLKDGKVVTPDGWADAYRQFWEGGWNGVAAPAAHGGMGLPILLQMAVSEMMTSANMAFGLCPLLTQGAIHALEAHGTDEQKERYLGKLVTGEWTGTMNLTEPQAGSDVGALTTKAEPAGDGTYKITGTKIYITYGDHEMAENIIHLVLARLPDAPLGTRGISLFLVPKYLLNEDGTPGTRNALRPLSLEKKLGIHASPTCVMSYEGATGFLVGEENQGMKAMFTMMNDARLGVGTQGVGIMERAFQQALAYAQERKQGKPVGKQHAQKEMVPIIEHADVRRTLLHMKALTMAARGLCYDTALHADLSMAAATEEERAAAKARVELLTPVAKSWSTDKGVEVASLGIQVHGGMGFIEETGAAQHLRDARIAPIYEGTNGIQALDLVARKLPMQMGGVVRAYLEEVVETADALRATNAPHLVTIADRLKTATEQLGRATMWIGQKLASGEIEDALAGATPYQSAFGTVAGGFYLAKGVLAAHKAGDESPTAQTALQLARFYAEQELPHTEGYCAAAMSGADLVGVTAEQLAS
ncbi:acyl-CoA dehydrogenase [Futiania mangrovi]|uniref:3-methylmercaptopropionyl-CoA dehydrogenase n=1 Tax=Futiania mangrovi TaxID=2959716 RepID=A0A9J6PAL2_9PROT|nr:acyl-CoA dehydrogenase [Futiania mangrovii]MCP1335094.1 acyl-CoA dehydrogenase [Futiania mangrovii]